MPYCPNCGNEVETGSRFCRGCGTKLDSSQNSQSDQLHPTEGEEIETGPQRTPQSEQTQRQPSDTSSTEQSPQTDETSQVDSEQATQPSWKHLSETSTGKKLAFAGGVLVIVGAFLPWLSVQALGTTMSSSGIEGDGIFTLLLAIITVVVIGRSNLHSWGGKTWVGVILIGSLVTLLALVYIIDPWAFADVNPTEEERLFIEIGAGLYLTALGGFMMFIGPLYDDGADEVDLEELDKKVVR